MADRTGDAFTWSEGWTSVSPRLISARRVALALAYLVVISARDAIDNPLSMPSTVTATRAFLREARRAFRGKFW